MKVLQVITKGETGGAQSHVRTLCAALSTQGVAVQAAIGGAGPLSPLGRYLETLGLHVHGIPLLDNGLRPVRLLRATRDLLRIVRAESPDLLHAHSAMAGVAARIAGALSGVPVIYTVHGFAFKAGNAWPRRAVAWTTEALLAPLTSRMVCVSEHERALARSLPLPSWRLETVVNGVDDIAVPADATAWKREGTSVAMVARMAPPKRHDLLLHALARLRDTTGQHGSATLLGDGPDRPAHEALAARLGLQSSVDFKGTWTTYPRSSHATGSSCSCRTTKDCPFRSSRRCVRAWRSWPAICLACASCCPNPGTPCSCPRTRKPSPLHCDN